MRRVALTIPEAELEPVLDALLPLLPQGVHWTPLGGGRLELAVYDTTGAMPSRDVLAGAVGPALLSAGEEEAPEDAGERRTRYLRRPAVGGRIVVRPSGAPPPEGDDVLDVVIDSPHGAFGSGGHPTTAMCLELLLGLRPSGGFADLGCGAGVLAITAARLGWAPVLAIDHERAGIEATTRNAAVNGVEVEALQLDLLEVSPPPVPTLAANVPIAVHARIAAGLAAQVDRVIASGVIDEHLPELLAGYERAGLAVRARRGGPGWAAVLLERGG
jgi:ribosomal protein L11 methyltransferase